MWFLTGSLMEDILQAFLERPSARAYRAVRQALLDQPDFQADVKALAEVARLCNRQAFAAAAERIQRMMPGWLLSPRVHGYAAWIAEELGDDEDVELERFLLSACLQGLLATGDGSQSRPFLVTYVSDQYDVLCWLGDEAAGQRLVAAGNRQFDVLTTAAGREYWFEVSGLLDLPGHQRCRSRAWKQAPPSLRELALTSRGAWN